MTTPTSNPVPSNNPNDLLFNAEQFDVVLNGTAASYTDRLGVVRRTVKGQFDAVDAELAAKLDDAQSQINVKVNEASGYADDAADSALEALGYLQTYRATSYGALASDPATDPLGNPPTEGDEYFNTTAKLLKRFNGVTWQASDINTANLAASSGSSLVGFDGGTVQDVLYNAKAMQSYTALRAYTGRATVVRITTPGIAGFFQRVSTTGLTDNGATVIVDALGRAWERLYSGAVKVSWFGAKGDWNGTTGTDNTPFIQAAINLLLANRTGPTGYSAYGQQTLEFDKGKYRVTDTLSFATSAIGFYIKGAGANVTSIEFTNDTAALINANTFIRFTIQDITMNHVAQSADPATWTCDMFKGNGSGGGRMLQILDAAVFGFNRIVNNTGGGNFDTFRAEGSDFQNFNCFYYGRNSQAVANSIRHCSFYSKCDLMQIAGVGHTIFDTCNINVDGAWLRLYGVLGLFGPTSQYTFINTKGEPMNISGFDGGSRTSIISLDGDKSSIACQIKLINSGLASGVTFDTSTAYPQIEMTSNMNIDWQGGQLKETSKIKLWPAQLINLNSLNHRGLFFDGLRLAPPPSQITREPASSANTTWPQVVYERTQAVPNICLGADVSATFNSQPPVMDRAVQTSCLGNGTNYYGILSFGSSMVHALDFYLSRQSVVDVAVQVTRKATAANLKIETSLDNFATVLDTIYVVGGSGSTYLPVARISDPAIGSKTQDWPSLTTGAQQSTTVTVLGARAGDPVDVSMSVALSGTRMWGEVTADDTVTVYQRNDTGSTVDVASGTLTAMVKRLNTAVNKTGNDKLYVRCSGPESYGYIFATVRAA